MLGDPDNESVSDRLSEAVFDRLSFIFPLRIIKQPERVTILDYRPTLAMFLTGVGILLVALGFVVLFFGMDVAIMSGLWTIGIPFLVCVVFLFKGTIREAYCFDKSAGTYTLVRQFIHRKEVIEGALGQFTGAYVKTERNEDSETYFVVLKQEGMFLTGVSEQTLREEVPIFNSFDKEARIANAISEYLHVAKRS